MKNCRDELGPNLSLVACRLERILDMSRDYLNDLNNDLNKEQRDAVKHGDSDKLARSGPLLVIAGAGSGKTKTLAHRVAHLIVNGVDPHRILLLTFSRRAANEMTRRVEKITATVLGAERCELPWSGSTLVGVPEPGNAAAFVVLCLPAPLLNL